MDVYGRYIISKKKKIKGKNLHCLFWLLKILSSVLTYLEMKICQKILLLFSAHKYHSPLNYTFRINLIANVDMPGFGDFTVNTIT